jgi:hypothetical protein
MVRSVMQLLLEQEKKQEEKMVATLDLMIMQQY